MIDSVQERLIRSTDCEIRFDHLARLLYATDASIYQIMPLGVAFPKSAAQAASLMRAAADAGVPVIPRGAGTGLAGATVGEGLVIDFSRHNRRIIEFDRDKCVVRVQPGVVLDQLNEFLKPHGLWFGPDVATSARATLGGMIANNSSGAHAPVYGTTDDHVFALEIVLADGTVATIGVGGDGLPEHREAVDQIIDRCARQIEERFPPVLCKRWPGYGLDRYLRDKGNLTHLISASEGTLALITSAVLKVVPIPGRKRMGLVFFDSVEEALAATVELVDLKPAAIEHIDRLLFDQTKGQLAFKTARALMRLDEDPCEAILYVEFFGEDDDKLNELEKRRLGRRTLICKDAAEQELVVSIRKQGLSLLSACKGPAKTIPGIEDACVVPAKLPDYVRGMRKIFDALGLRGSFYGHAASGLLHIRARIDLHEAQDIAKYRKMAEEVSDLVREFGGSLAAEHGVGFARAEFMPDQLGPDLMQATRDIKKLFDPRNLLNPGKIIPDGLHRIDTHLRYGAGHRIEPPFETMFGFVERDESFIGNLEQCNGCGFCRKDAPTMCPTFLATGDELMVTRGRANIIRAALEHRTENRDPLDSPELEAALSNCLSCKACKTECPANVDLALLKAEMNHARQQRDGIPLVDRLISNAELLGRINAGLLAPITNTILRMRLVRWLMEKTLGFAADRTMPPYTRHRFDKWFAERTDVRKGVHGKVILWDDCWVRYNEPNIGQAAVKVLEAAGFDIVLPDGRKCCGRPACSRGVLDMVKNLANHNVDLFRTRGGIEPIIFLEPSCYTMFIDEYRQLRIPGADEVAARCVLFEQFVFELLQRQPDAIPFKNGGLKVAIHGHCHAKALTDASIMPKLVEKIPGTSARLLDTGCCGMAGAFGMLKSKQELSRKVAQDLLDKINATEPGTTLVASGTSCRHQINHFTDRHPLHMAELLAKAI
ncbi:MAG: FAD-binding and (Fe-S)-binding domain-containing protein [Phycisphaerae bacterium]